MRRREILAAAATSVWSLPLGAQQKAMPMIGFLSGGGPEVNVPFVAAFREGLNESGFVEGQNVVIDYRWAEGHYDRLPAFATDLIRRKVDVIAASGNPAVARAAKRASRTVPIVYTGSNDPVADGLVASLARPGGNLTGVTSLVAALNPKRLELLRELVPQAGVIGLLVNPDNSNTEREMRDLQEAARASGVQLLILKASGASEIATAFPSLVQGRAGALIVQNDQLFIIRRGQLVALASRDAVPAIYSYREYGGLISYGPSLRALFRQSGIYAGRILKGTKPADLPFLQPTMFELVVNLKTAKALGLTIPPSILARADEVIE